MAANGGPSQSGSTRLGGERGVCALAARTSAGIAHCWPIPHKREATRLRLDGETIGALAAIAALAVLSIHVVNGLS